jgi:hypothetical protein
MTRTDLLAASVGALILAFVAGWAVSDTQARVPQDDGPDRSQRYDDRRKATAHRALCRLFLSVLTDSADWEPLGAPLHRQPVPAQALCGHAFNCRCQDLAPADNRSPRVASWPCVGGAYRGWLCGKGGTCASSLANNLKTAAKKVDSSASAVEVALKAPTAA